MQKQSKTEWRLKFGPYKCQRLALLYPLTILGSTVIIAYFYVDISITKIDPKKGVINLDAGIIIDPLILILTDEGF